MINWKTYCALCKEKKIVNPYKTESEFNRAYGIVENKVVEPMILAPKKRVVNKSVKEVAQPPKKSQTVQKKQVRASIRKKPVLIDEERKENKKLRQKEYYRKKVGREVQKRLPPMDLSGMSQEERRQHRIKKQKEYRERLKASGKKYTSTAEQRAKRNEYFKDYYAENRNDKEYMKKRSEWTKNYRMNQQKKTS